MYGLPGMAKVRGVSLRSTVGKRIRLMAGSGGDGA